MMRAILHSVAALLAACFVLAPVPLAAQGTVQVTLAGIPPVLPSPFLGDVERDFRSGSYLAVVNVTSTAPVTVRFRFTLEHEGRRLVETVSDPVTYAPGTYTYRTFKEAPDIDFPASADDLRQQAIDALGYTVISTGVLPEGRYTARLEPLAETIGVIGLAGTASFIVRYPAPAIPLTPTQGEVLTTPYPVFSWSFTDMLPGAQTEFELVLVERLPTQTVLQALEGNRPILSERISTITTFVYTPDRLALDTAKHYAWRLHTRVTLSGRPVPVREEGLSEPRAFQVGMLAAPPPAEPPTEPPPVTEPTPVSTTALACGVELPTSRVPAERSASSYAGSKIRLGRFELTVEEASGSSAALNGRGYISVPFLRAPLRVAFAGLAVNEEGIAYAGAASALPAAAAAGMLSAGVLGTFTGGAESLATETLGPAYTFARGSGQLTSGFTGTTPVGLPIGVDQGMTGTGWILAVLGVAFTPTGAQANVVLDAPMPALGGNLALGARGVCIDPDGLGSGGETILALLREVSLNVGGIGHRFMAAGTGSAGTHAVWKRVEFDRLQLAMETSYPREMLIPVDGAGTRLEGQTRGRFSATVRNAGGWIATGTLDPSDLAAVPGFGFTTATVIYDNSLTANPEGMVFPEGYEGDRSAAWTGVYVPDLSLRLPAALRRFGGERIAANARGLLLDATGVSLAATLNNVILAGTPGDLGGWAYTLDRLTLQLVHSSLKRGEMAGGVRVPVGTDLIPYTALLSLPPGRDRLSFQFKLTPPAEIDARVWMARLALQPSSHLMVRDTMLGGSVGFHAEAMLNGHLSITTTVSGFPLDFRLVRFEQLGLSTAAPYVQPGLWEKGSPQHYVGGEAGSDAPGAGGFPVEVTGIRAVTRTPSGGGIGVGLAIGLLLKVPGAGDWLEARTGVTPWGRFTMPGAGPMTAAFDELVLDSIAVKGNLSGVLEAEGMLSFYREDAAFGTGMGGSLRARVLEKVEARAEARFGTRTGTPYWYVDAAFASNDGVMLMSGVGLYGLGGGASRHITRVLPTQAELMAGTGTAKSYRVDPAAAFELRASAVVGTYPSPKPFNGDVLLSATFTGSGGLAKLGLNGAGYFMTDGPMDRPADPTARGTVDLEFVVGPPRFFDGRFSFDINRPPARGRGTAAIYFGPERWFVRAGNPTDTRDIGLRLGLAGVGIDTHSYLYVGQDVPPLPPPPPLAPQPPVSTPAAAAGGSGFAFGARAGFSVEETYLIFYAALNAGLGFDMAMLNNSRCEGLPGLAGLRGWYATGQMYAYLDGAVGIDVNTWAYRGRLEAFRVAAGALLIGGAPNPVWADGTLHGSYSVLGGMLSGNVAFEMSLGDRCIPAERAGGALGDIALITDVRPAGGELASVFEEPAAAFALRLNQPFDIVDDRGQKRTFRIVSGGFEVRPGAASAPPITGSLRMEDDGGVLLFTPATRLQEHTTYHVRVSAHAEERSGSIWARARMRDGGVIPAHEHMITFRTGPLPKTILPGDVKYTYPVDRQRYFLPGQAPEGRVEFRAGHVNYVHLTQPEQAGGTVEVVVRFIPAAGGTPVETPAIFENGRVRFRIPALQRETNYALQIVRREGTPAPAVAQGVGGPGFGFAPAEISRLQRNLSPAVAVYTLNRTLPGRRVQPGERLLFHSHFRTSRFGTLQEKVARATVPRPATRPSGYAYLYDVPVDLPEPFDVFDLEGRGAVRALVEFHSMTPAMNTRWARDWGTPHVYRVRTRLASTGLFGDALGSMSTALITTSASGAGVLLAPGSRRPRPPLSDAELLGTPASSAGTTYLVSSAPSAVSRDMMGGLGYSIQAMAPEAVAPTYVFRFRWNDAVSEDWRSTRSHAATAVAIYRSRPLGRPFDAATYQYFSAEAARPFVAPWAGNYPIQFVGRFPWGASPAGAAHTVQFPIR
jgi:hypothetical protein